MFHIGKISKTIGNAFACSDHSVWTGRSLQSPSGLSTVNSSIFHQFLVNREGTHAQEKVKRLSISYITWVSLFSCSHTDRGREPD